MNPIELNLPLTIDETNIQSLTRLLRREFHVGSESESQRNVRLKTSQPALFAGETQPTDRGLLINMNEVAKLLGVSPRTVWKMEHAGEMPKAIRIGKAVRWGYDEIKYWVDSGCPNAEVWRTHWPRQRK